MLALSVSSITRRSMPIPWPAVGGRPYSSARTIVAVLEHRFLVACILRGDLRIEARFLVFRVVQLGEAVGDLAADDEQLETLGDLRARIAAARQRRDFDRIVDDEGRLEQMRFGQFFEQRQLQAADAIFRVVFGFQVLQLVDDEVAIIQLRIGELRMEFLHACTMVRRWKGLPRSSSRP